MFRDSSKFGRLTESFPSVPINRIPRRRRGAGACVNSFAYDFMAKSKHPANDFNVTIMFQVPVTISECCSLRVSIMQKVARSEMELQLAGRLADGRTSLGLTTILHSSGTKSVDFSCAPNRTPYFPAYGIERNDVGYIMEHFPIVKRRDVESYGSFRTMDLIVERYDAMAEAIRTGVPYQTVLDPMPGTGLGIRARTERGHGADRG